MAGEIQGYHVSQQQRRLWFMQQGSHAFRAQCAVRIKGDLNVAALQNAVGKVVSRHEILRTTFALVPGIKTPLQRVAESCAPDWRFTRLEDSDPNLDFAIEETLEHERRAYFDLARGPLLRCALLEITSDSHLLIMTMPSLCADAWTLRMLFEELFTFYDGTPESPSEAVEPGQYADFCAWQSDLTDDRAADAKTFWQGKDHSILPTMKVPFESRTNWTGDFDPRAHRSLVAHDVAEMIYKLAERYQVQESVILFACWQTLLFRLTGQAEIITATVSDGRKYDELYKTFGLFSKWLPIQTLLDLKYRFDEIIEQASESFVNVNEWQEYYIWNENIGASGETVEYPPVGFSYDSFPAPLFNDESAFAVEQIYTCFDKSKIYLSCIRSTNSLFTEFHYDARAFTPDRINRLAGHFHRLLESVVGDPQAAIGKLEILRESERREILFDFNKTQTEDSRDFCAHRLFEHQAALTPDSIAVVFEDTQLSYEELNRRSNKIAHHLKELGVRTEEAVAICLDRSVEIIVSILGALKSGGAYVPLDPAHPRERLLAMLEDTKAKIVLSAGRLVDSLPSKDLTVINLDDAERNLAQQSGLNLDVMVTPANLAYILFTSGSTGGPKGVAIEHRQLSNYLLGVRDRLDLPSDASYATVSTFAADLGNTMIFPSLCSGGRLHVVSQECAADTDALANYIDVYAIDCLKIVPSHMQALLSSARMKRSLPRARLILGGESCGWDLVNKIDELGPDCRVFNHYGPTETTVGVSTFAIITNLPNEGSMAVPIGQPTPNLNVYLLDPDYNPMPVGISGEIFIGGSGLARGYLNRPDRTAEKFIPNPFTSQQGGRLYRTGDLGHMLFDNNVEFLGRTDTQVKFHGYRVELNEIRNALKKHSRIRDSVVVVMKDDKGDAAIVAYYVCKQEMESAELRHFLAESLIQEMLPNFFVHLKRLPLTLNGKINHSALPTLDEAKQMVKRNFVPPGNPTQQQIAAIWSQFLSIDRIGIHDDFFEMGGHSLLATRVISRLRQLFNVEIPLRMLFEAPTIAELAEYLTNGQPSKERARASIIPARLQKARSLEDQLGDLALLSEDEAGNLLESQTRLTEAEGRK
ncbi:MAG: amino acid adenylation domain-containing protein [Blastocatellia bacterium]